MAARHGVADLRPGESIEHLLTAEDRFHWEQSVEAAARGDARAAWEYHMAGLVVNQSLTRHRLHELVLLGDDAPGWMYSRWTVDQAALWMLTSQDPRCDEFVKLVLAFLHTDQLDELVGDPQSLQEYGTLVAATDWVYQELAVYEGGGLRDFLDAVAQERLLSHVDEIDAWERTAMTAYELEAAYDDVLLVRRLADDQPIEVLNLGAATDSGLGSTVLGRVVPISVWPGWMFATRPLLVDRVTAEDAARSEDTDDLGWLGALARAHEAGRLPARATWGQGTLYSTDIVPMPDGEDGPEDELPGRMRDLLAAGLSAYVANGVCVAEVALIAAEVSPAAVSAVGPHLTAVLMDPRVHDAIRIHALLPGHGPRWQALAAATPSPVRERCLELATQCELRDAS